MLSIEPIAPTGSARVAVVVDLIGDLDATLGDILAETLLHLTRDRSTDVFLTTRHVAVTSTEGLAALEAAVAAARTRDCTVTVVPGNRRMRAAFANAGIGDLGRDLGTTPFCARHVMIARHARSKPGLRSA